MEAPQTLRRPANWQDFESLCKKLWGEIWECPEIQKNGRLGQKQSGVDIFGIPFNEDKYYGIQCKGKCEYNNSQLTEKEVDEEIEKAKKFNPSLKKFYFATTAENDCKIQEYIRNKNLEHKSKGLFEVHIFCWESIVDLIEENKKTFDWYVKNQNYKISKSVAISFRNGLSEITCNPKFKKTITHYTQKILPAFDFLYTNPFLGLTDLQNKFPEFQIELISNKTTINLSYFPIEIFIHNTGDEPIEEFKILLDFDGDIIDLSNTNENNSMKVPFINNYIHNTLLWTESMSGKIIPKNSILVGDDTICSEEIFIKPHHKESEIIIKWKLISRDFKDNGELIVKILPEIEIEQKTILIEDPLKVRTKEEIKDYIIEKKENV